MPINASKLSSLFQPLTHWQARYRQIILLSNGLAPFPPEMKIESNQITQCESLVWLVCEKKSEQTLTFYGDSESRIMKGFLAILLSLANEKTAQEIVDTDFFSLLKQFNIIDQLTESKQVGITHIIKRIKLIAQQR